MRKILAIILGKTIQKLVKTLKIGGGSAAPGLYALKIDPNLIEELAVNIPQTIIITGTNGKTTTAKLLAHFAKAQGLEVIRNHTGSNLARGIASSLISACHLGGGKLKHYDLAVWELDEAAFNNLAPKLKAQAIVFLNVFRDQLDRYGEIDSVVKKWTQTLSKVSSNIKIYLNGDDQNLLKLKESFKGKVQTFGLGNNKILGETVIQSTLSTPVKLDLEAINIQPRGLDKINFRIKSQAFTLPVPGIYNVYNFLAAFALAQDMGINQDTILQSLKNFAPAFGRVEKFDFGFIFLIKNPVGASQVLQTIKTEIKSDDRLLLALDDNLADGTDVSWIWDTNFEILRNSSKIFVSGKRALDLAVRLKYAGFNTNNLTVETHLERAFKEAREGLKGQLFILPTYTCLLSLQQILARTGIKKHYWEEKIEN